MAPALSLSLQPGGSAEATGTTAGARQWLLWLNVGESGAKSVNVHSLVLLRHCVGKRENQYIFKELSYATWGERV